MQLFPFRPSAFFLNQHLRFGIERFDQSFRLFFAEILLKALPDKPAIHLGRVGNIYIVQIVSVIFTHLNHKGTNTPDTVPPVPFGKPDSSSSNRIICKFIPIIYFPKVKMPSERSDGITQTSRSHGKRRSATAGCFRVRIADDELRTLQTFRIVDFRTDQILIAHRIDQKDQTVFLNFKSSSFLISSKVNPYWKPEQPPPLTKTRNFKSGCFLRQSNRQLWHSSCQ